MEGNGLGAVGIVDDIPFGCHAGFECVGNFVQMGQAAHGFLDDLNGTGIFGNGRVKCRDVARQEGRA